VRNRGESRAGDPGTRPAGLSRRAFIGAGAVAGLSAAGLTFRGLARPAFAAQPSAVAPFGPVQVAPDDGSYARAVRLSTAKQGQPRPVLATYQRFASAPFPLYRSDDNGQTWVQQGNIVPPGSPAGIYLQPYLYELPRAFASLPKGALLFACNFWPFDFTKPFPFASTNIQLYASTNAGLTWSLMSTVAQGGPPDTTNGATPVWEPFLLLHENKLICYYSDQRDPNYGQKLAHQVSTDLVTWGPVVNDATGTIYPQRPGMTTIAQLRGDLWIMTYEFGDPVNGDTSNYTFHVHYRLATNPESFGSSADIPLVDQNGNWPNASPTVSWSDSGGSNGTIIVTGNDEQNLFINRALGDPGQWTQVSSPIPAGYSRQTIPIDDPAEQRDDLVLIVTGAQYGKRGDVEAGIIALGESTKATPGQTGNTPGQDRHAFIASAAAYVIAHRSDY
jgi:hypothetical protein